MASPTTIHPTDVFHGICEIAREHNCRVIAVDEPTETILFTSYVFPAVRLVLNQMVSQVFFERIFLHEVCHHITWNHKWRPVWTPSGWRRAHPTMYLCEYKAEKLCRRIASSKGWDHIVDESNQMLCGIIDRATEMSPEQRAANKVAGHLWGWPYARNRIVREEKLFP